MVSGCDIGAGTVCLETNIGDMESIGRELRTRPPMRNRVTPMGDIVATELRGAWLGNRGIIHRGTEIVRFHASNLWIVCALEFRGRRTRQWAEGRYTALFFHDEAVAFAAGHRPCAECRRDAYDRYRLTSSREFGGAVPSAKEMNALLHAERLVRGTHTRRLYPMDWEAVPAGTFVVVEGSPALALDHVVVPWTVDGYTAGRVRPCRGTVEVITPPLSVEALRAGYPVQIDSSAAAQDVESEPGSEPFE
jgi:hypothetical protein